MTMFRPPTYPLTPRALAGRDPLRDRTVTPQKAHVASAYGSVPAACGSVVPVAAGGDDGNATVSAPSRPLRRFIMRSLSKVLSTIRQISWTSMTPGSDLTAARVRGRP